MMKDQMCTFYTLPVSKQDYEKIKNFCEDHNIENVPERNNIYLELCTRKGAHIDKKDFVLSKPITLPVDGLEVIDCTGSPGNSGEKILIAVGESKEFEEEYYAFMNAIDQEETYNEEPLEMVIISNFYEGDHDMQFLTTEFREYLGGELHFEEANVRYLSEEDLTNFVMNGRQPCDDE